jgi:hypothetical protein
MPWRIIEGFREEGLFADLNGAARRVAAAIG